MADVYLKANFDAAGQAAVGKIVDDIFNAHEKDRKGAEEQWLKNLRQFRGIYDPDIEKMIPADQSKAYPKVTRQKVIGTVARLMEMLFPQTDKNYEVTSSPLPNLSMADTQKVLDQLVAEKGAENLTNELIEAGIKSVADKKAARMDLEIRDQLVELDYVNLAKRLVFSAVLYGIGVLKGPMVRTEPTRTWKQGPTGAWVAITEQRKRPFFESCPVWDWYPDLSAKSLEPKATDGDCQRHILSRTQLEKLRERPDFIKDNITKYLKDHRNGNYRERDWEKQLRSKSADRSNITDLSGRKYEAIEYWGRITGHQLKACGYTVPVNQLSEELEVNLWVIEKTVIKAVANPYDGRIRGYHAFIFEEDEINLLGNGLPQILRDSQLAICEASRMVLDNGSVVCGPMLEVNQSLLMPGTDLGVYSRKVWLREDLGFDSGSPAVREIRVDAHIAELISIIELFRGFADVESALPPPALGDVSGQGKESLRTSGNLSMLMGAAALPIRDTVRNFDKFTTSFITSLCHWNLEFSANDDIKGDFTVIARGSTSLIAKEVRAQAINTLSLALTEDERIYLSTEKTVLEKLRVLDLPKELLEEPDVVKQKLAERAAAASAAAEQQAALTRAQIRGEIAAAFKDLMNGLKAQAGANAETFSTIVEGIISARAAEQQSAESNGGARTSPKSPQPSERAGVKGAS